MKGEWNSHCQSKNHFEEQRGNAKRAAHTLDTHEIHEILPLDKKRPKKETFAGRANQNEAEAKESERVENDDVTGIRRWLGNGAYAGVDWKEHLKGHSNKKKAKMR